MLNELLIAVEQTQTACSWSEIGNQKGREEIMWLRRWQQGRLSLTWDAYAKQSTFTPLHFSLCFMRG